MHWTESERKEVLDMADDCSAVDPRYRLSDAELAMVAGTWPLELLLDPAKHPRIVDTAEDFLKELLVGDHMSDFVVLQKGVDKLDLRWEDCMPLDIRESISGCSNVYDFAQKVRARPGMADFYRSDIEYIDPSRQQRDVLRKEKNDLGKRIDEITKMVCEGEVDPELLYIAEMRQKKEIPHPIGGDKAKTVCLRDVKDCLGPYATWTLYWDRYDEGFFAGGRRSGKGAHVDQVFWSNVGRHWQGYKLVASWPKGEISKDIGMNFYDRLFYPPISGDELAALQMAAKIVLLRPGDVYLFSGGVAHTVICVSSEMCLGAYESIVTLNPSHIEHFMHTDDTRGPYCLEKFSMSSKELKDTKDDCLDQLEDIADQIERGGPIRAPDPGTLYPDSWRGLWAKLHVDEQVQSMIRSHFARTVELCSRDRYFSRHLADSVLRNAILCGADLADSFLSSGKRRRLNSESPSSSRSSSVNTKPPLDDGLPECGKLPEEGGPTEDGNSACRPSS